MATDFEVEPSTYDVKQFIFSSVLQDFRAFKYLCSQHNSWLFRSSKWLFTTYPTEEHQT